MLICNINGRKVEFSILKSSPGTITFYGPFGIKKSISVRSIQAGETTLPFSPKHWLWKAEEKLRTGEHRTPPEGYPTDRSLYAIPETYTFPLDTEKRVRSAISYFDKHSFRDAKQKREAARRIMRFARKYHIEVGEHDKVREAAE